MITIAIPEHIDSGKLIVTGHLIYKGIGINETTIEKCQKEAAEMEKDSLMNLESWITRKLSVSMLSLLTSPCGNLRPASVMRWSLMLQDPETLLREC